MSHLAVQRFPTEAVGQNQSAGQEVSYHEMERIVALAKELLFTYPNISIVEPPKRFKELLKYIIHPGTRGRFPSLVELYSYKTHPCKSYNLENRCNYFNKCNFHHDEQEKKSFGDLVRLFIQANSQNPSFAADQQTTQLQPQVAQISYLNVTSPAPYPMNPYGQQPAYYDPHTNYSSASYSGPYSSGQMPQSLAGYSQPQMDVAYSSGAYGSQMPAFTLGGYPPHQMDVTYSGGAYGSQMPTLAQVPAGYSQTQMGVAYVNGAASQLPPFTPAPVYSQTQMGVDYVYGAASQLPAFTQPQAPLGYSSQPQMGVDYVYGAGSQMPTFTQPQAQQGYSSQPQMGVDYVYGAGRQMPPFTPAPVEYSQPQMGVAYAGGAYGSQIPTLAQEPVEHSQPQMGVPYVDGAQPSAFEASVPQPMQQSEVSQLDSSPSGITSETAAFATQANALEASVPQSVQQSEVSQLDSSPSAITPETAGVPQESSASQGMTSLKITINNPNPDEPRIGFAWGSSMRYSRATSFDSLTVINEKKPSTPPVRSDRQRVVVASERVQICREYLDGHCAKGELCALSHTVSLLKPLPLRSKRSQSH